MTTLKIQISLVLWDRLCGKGEKNTQWDNLSDACAFVEQIESGLKMRVYNGVLHWEEGHHTLATASARIVDF